MPLAFSFQSQHLLTEDFPSWTDSYSEMAAPEEAAAPPPVEAPEPAPLRESATKAQPVTGGLAALAVSQSAPLPLRPVSPPLMPKTAIAACLASAALTPGGLLGSAETDRAVATAPQIEPWKPALDDDVNELRNDVFGAVMGVSALKDRLDSLETLLARLETAVSRQAESPPPAAAGPDRDQVIAWVGEWLAGRVDTLVEHKLEDRLQHLDGTRFFRLSAGSPHHDRATALATAPVILATVLP